MIVRKKSGLRFIKFIKITCDRAGLVDFAELLIRAYELFAKKPVILQRLSATFSAHFGG